MGSASWVAAARGASGQRVVLKVGWRHDEALSEADGLRACDGRGADEFDARRAATRSSAIERDRGLERAGIELLRELPRSAAEHVLLCTDLHAGNVLAAQREPWLVIDPKPYVGDPTYDALQHMLNCDRLTADPSGFVRRMAGLLDLDPQRLRAGCSHAACRNPSKTRRCAASRSRWRRDSSRGALAP